MERYISIFDGDRKIIGFKYEELSDGRIATSKRVLNKLLGIIVFSLENPRIEESTIDEV